MGAAKGHSFAQVSPLETAAARGPALRASGREAGKEVQLSPQQIAPSAVPVALAPAGPLAGHEDHLRPHGPVSAAAPALASAASVAASAATAPAAAAAAAAALAGELATAVSAAAAPAGASAVAVSAAAGG
eukprot:216489-Pelagomonas_calceolata.AAC.2